MYMSYLRKLPIYVMHSMECSKLVFALVLFFLVKSLWDECFLVFSCHCKNPHFWSGRTTCEAFLSLICAAIVGPYGVYWTLLAWG